MLMNIHDAPAGAQAFSPLREGAADYPQLLRALLAVKLAALRANCRLGLVSADKLAGLETLWRDPSAPVWKGEFCRELSVCWGTRLVRSFDHALLQAWPSEGSAPTLAELTLSLPVGAQLASAQEIAVHDSLAEVADSAARFAGALSRQAQETRDVVACARVDLRDGMPCRLGDAFSAYSLAVSRNADRILAEAATWNQSLLGCSDTGSERGIPPGFREEANRELSEILERPLHGPERFPAAMSCADRVLLAHAHVQALAVAVWRVSRDLILLCSGPRGGIREIAFPAIAPGSSIMPGKVNPTVAELAASVADRVCANHLAASEGCLCGLLGHGSFSAVPLRSVMESCQLLARALDTFRAKVIEGLTVFPDRCRALAERSAKLADVLAEEIGGNRARQAAELAGTRGIPVSRAAAELGFLTEERAAAVLDIDRMV